MIIPRGGEENFLTSDIARVKMVFPIGFMKELSLIHPEDSIFKNNSDSPLPSRRPSFRGQINVRPSKNNG